MGGSTYLQFVAALLFVLTLIGLLAVVARRFGLGYGTRGVNRSRRLRISEVLPLDSRRKLVLLRRDEVEHLIILGTTSETVIEANIVIRGNAAVAGSAPSVTNQRPRGTFARLLATGREEC
jgi:flagellar protein FliO/FliZ